MQQSCKVVKSKNIFIKDNDLIIDIQSIELHNNELFEVIICQNKPENSNSLNVVKIKINDIIIPVHNTTGNYTRADQIKSRTRYPLIYGVDPLHISLLYRIYPSKFNYDLLEEK